ARVGPPLAGKRGAASSSTLAVVSVPTTVVAKVATTAATVAAATTTTGSQALPQPPAQTRSAAYTKTMLSPAASASFHAGTTPPTPSPSPCPDRVVETPNVYLPTKAAAVASSFSSPSFSADTVTVTGSA
ncbi:unnamed protein product, partial [Laminaria digitata]